MSEIATNNKKEKKESLFSNLLFNVIIPALILTKFSSDAYLGPFYGLIIALMFPLTYGLYELIVQKKTNFISILGFVSVLLTGVIGIMEFPLEYIAIKEAAIPFLIGMAVLISIWTPFSLVKKIIYNKEMLDIESIERNLSANNNTGAFEKVLKRASVLLASSFFFSSVLNYILAKVMVTSQPGTVAFTEELGQMTWMSYPVIALPSMLILFGILYYLISSLQKLTNLSRQEIFSEKLRG